MIYRSLQATLKSRILNDESICFGIFKNQQNRFKNNFYV